MATEGMNVEKKKVGQANAHVFYCKPKICLDCREFDLDYHDGYCHIYKVDTRPTNHCIADGFSESKGKKL